MVTFKCQNCKFEYTPKDKTKTLPQEKCPYCNQIGKIFAKKHVLEEIQY